MLAKPGTWLVQRVKSGLSAVLVPFGFSENCNFVTKDGNEESGNENAGSFFLNTV